MKSVGGAQKPPRAITSRKGGSPSSHSCSTHGQGGFYDMGNRMGKLPRSVAEEEEVLPQKT